MTEQINGLGQSDQIVRDITLVFYRTFRICHVQKDARTATHRFAALVSCLNHFTVCTESIFESFRCNYDEYERRLILKKKRKRIR